MALGIFNLIGCIFIPFIINPQFLQSSWNRRATKKARAKHYAQKNTREITITQTELVFATDYSEEAWKWAALKSLYEGTNGLVISFYSMHQRIVSKRVFAEAELQQFKNTIQNHLSEGADVNYDSSDGYKITAKDLIEAKQLEAMKSDTFKFYLFVCVLFLLSILILILKIESLDFFVFGYYLQDVFGRLDNSEYWFTILFYSLLLLFFLGKIFPKINPLAYWNIKQDLQKNFIKREAKQISVTSEGIAIASQNYRKYYQWQGIAKTAENKQIFLLYHSRNKEYTIVPKRIFESEAELINFRHLLNKET